MSSMDVLTSLSITEDSYSIYVQFMHVTCIINSVVTMLVLLLITLHTPLAMAAYKWYLINLALTCYAMDLFTGLFFIPINILPIYGGCTLGLLKPLNSSATYIGWGVLNMLLGIAGAATIYAMLYRAMSVYNKEYLLKRKPIVLIMVLAEITYAWPAVITADLVHPGNEESVKFISENFPSMLDFYITHSCSILATNLNQMVSYLIVAMASIIIVCSTNLSLAIFIVRGLRKMRHSMSKKTYRLQQQLTVSVILQWLIPTGMITISYITFAVVASMQLSSSRTVCFITFLVSTFHTTVNGVIMIATIRPYKDAFVKYVRIVVRKRQVAALSSPVINRDISIRKLTVAAANPPIQPS